MIWKVPRVVLVLLGSSLSVVGPSFGPVSEDGREKLMMDVEVGYMDEMAEMEESPSKRTKNIPQGLIPQGQ